MINVNGHRIEFRNGQVILNGQRMVPADGTNSGVSITMGEEYTLNLDQDGKVVGDVHGSLTVQGNNVTLIIQGRVGGSVNTGGSVTCEKVGGSVNAATVTCDRVGGSVNAAVVNRK